MATKQETVTVSKELSEFGDALATLLTALKAKKADGLSVPEIVSAVGESLPALIVGLEGLEKTQAEFLEDKKASFTAAGLVGGKVLGAVFG